MDEEVCQISAALLLNDRDAAAAVARIDGEYAHVESIAAPRTA